MGRGSGQDASHRAAQAPSLSRKVEGLSPRMGLRNTRIQAVPGLHWLAAQPQWVTILVGLRAIVVGLSFLNGSGDGTEHLLFLSGG